MTTGYLRVRAGVHTINAYSRSAIGVDAQTYTSTSAVGPTDHTIQFSNHINYSGQRGVAGGGGGTVSGEIDRSVLCTGGRLLGRRGGGGYCTDWRGVRDKYVNFTL